MISMSKGDKPVTLAKTPVITATVRWDSNTDYDLYALVLYTDGATEAVAMFPAAGQPASAQTTRFPGAVRHLGDVGRTGDAGGAKEVLEIRLVDAVRAVVPVAYSAQSNGTGSFHQYKVFMEIDNGSGGVVGISSDHANRSSTVYTCAIGVVENTTDGVLVHALEEYSSSGSENRPAVDTDRRGRVRVRMDKGPANAYK